MKTQNLVRQADILILEKKYPQALDLLTLALKKDKRNPEIFYLLGDVLCKLERFGEAITMLKRANRLLPKNPQIYHLLGWAIFMNGDTPTARAFLEYTLAKDPHNQQIYSDLAVLEIKAHNLDLARTYVSKGKKLAPDDPIFSRLENLINNVSRYLEQINRRSN